MRSTDAERALWSALRAKRLEGLKFRRHQPLGAYIVDFVSFAAKLVVEADGGQHDEEQRTSDMQRTRWLESQGFRVLRFWNNDVLTNIEGVVDVIMEATHPRSPSP